MSARNAVVSLVALRIVYAINWLNVGAIFYLMEPDLGGGVFGLGALTSSFYVGIGLMQVPGGILAAKYGPRRVVAAGALLSSLAALGTAFSPDVLGIAALRFVVGWGMAFVFAPAVVMVAKLFRSGRSGIGVGLFNSAFDVGGLLGLFGWPVIAAEFGWRQSLALSGGLGVATGLLMLAFVPRDEAGLGFRVKASELLKIVKDGQLIVLGFGTLGLTIGNTLVSSFMFYYLVNVVGAAPVLAGAVSSAIYVIPIYFAFVGGRLYDRLRRPKVLMLASNLAMAASLALSAYPTTLGALGCTLVGGVASGVGFTVTFAAAKDMNKAEKQYDGLAVAWVNSISLFGSFWPPLVFSYLAGALGYPQAWLGGALMILLLTSPFLLLRDERTLRVA